jgi:hypothetical protein
MALELALMFATVSGYSYVLLHDLLMHFVVYGMYLLSIFYKLLQVVHTILCQMEVFSRLLNCYYVKNNIESFLYVHVYFQSYYTIYIIQSQNKIQFHIMYIQKGFRIPL